MKRFRFQLQTALEWRKRRMETEQARVEECELRRQQLAMAREEADNDFAESQRAILQSATITAADLTALEGYRFSVENRKQRIDRESARVLETLARQRQILMQTTREYRLIEKLKERQLAEWRKAADLAMEIEAGELYLANWTPPEDSS